MKLLLFVVIFSVAQICICSPIASSETALSDLTDSDIDKMRQIFTSIPGVDPQIMDNFTNIFYNFRENSTNNEVLAGTIKFISLAVNVDVSIINRTLLALSQNRSHSCESKNLRDFTDGRITEVKLKDLEDAFLKELTPLQTKQVMEIFRGFREGASSKETENTIFDLLVSAMYGPLIIPAKNKDGHIIEDEDVIIYELNEN
ncbi:uncharacterized protein LOC129575643 [Sitodiplosis mosellana]|uniref:uncharacterized protein LOC129575643 n=1 Tax=Sitodiplosis mosellana TaxID=263140 RepID=UPI002443E2B0|nr:uncharacterized protein LOC129575643 [Sitodiplosis mosellana]